MGRASTVALALLAIACSDQGPTTPVGIFDLATVHGHGLPAPYPDPHAGVTYYSGALTIRADGSFEETTQYDEQGVATTAHESGTWLREAGVVHLAYAAGGTGCPLGDCLVGTIDAELHQNTVTKWRYESVLTAYIRRP